MTPPPKKKKLTMTHLSPSVDRDRCPLSTHKLFISEWTNWIDWIWSPFALSICWHRYTVKLLQGRYKSRKLQKVHLLHKLLVTQTQQRFQAICLVLVLVKSFGYFFLIFFWICDPPSQASDVLQFDLFVHQSHSRCAASNNAATSHWRLSTECVQLHSCTDDQLMCHIYLAQAVMLC